MLVVQGSRLRVLGIRHRKGTYQYYLSGPPEAVRFSLVWQDRYALESRKQFFSTSGGLAAKRTMLCHATCSKYCRAACSFRDWANWHKREKFKPRRVSDTMLWYYIILYDIVQYIIL